MTTDRLQKSHTTAAAARSERQERFLTAFAKDGTIARAAKAAGISRETVYAWGRDDVDGFRQRFEYAKHEFRESLELGMFDVMKEKPAQTQLLRIFALKAHWPEKYREMPVDLDDEAREALREFRALQKQARETARSARALPEAKVTVEAASAPCSLWAERLEVCIYP